MPNRAPLLNTFKVFKEEKYVIQIKKQIKVKKLAFKARHGLGTLSVLHMNMTDIPKLYSFLPPHIRLSIIHLTILDG